MEPKFEGEKEHGHRHNSLLCVAFMFVIATCKLFGAYLSLNQIVLSEVSPIRDLGIGITKSTKIGVLNDRRDREITVLDV